MADEPTPTPPAVPLVYANFMTATGNPVDLSIDYGYRTPDGQAVPSVRVVMAWEHAALMEQVLHEALERYRQEFGEIRDVKADMGGGPVEMTIRGEGGEQR